MGRKKIKIQRIEDDRNRQVGARGGRNWKEACVADGGALCY